MATSTNKPRSSYFSPAELQILMTAYAESEHIYLLKSNTMAAAKKRELAWEKIADRVNAWVFIWDEKMKYKNVVQTGKV